MSQAVRREPQRTCVGCRAKSDRSALTRYVLVDGALVLDERAVMPGRGAWVHPEPGCYTRASQRGGFSRAFRQKISG